MASDSNSTSTQSELYKFGQTISNFARSYQFALKIEFPSGVKTKLDPATVIGEGKDLDEKNITMLCESMTLPQRTYNGIEIMVQSGKPPIRLAGQVTYTSWSVNFRSPAGMRMRDIFLAWQDQISTTGELGKSGGRKMAYNPPKSYKVDGCEAIIKLKPTEDKDAIGVRYKFYGLYPSDVSGVQFSHSDTGIVNFSVEFTYDFYDVIFKKTEEKKDPPKK